ncbi:MOP flippase family protein [Microbacterium sp.]|uniref:MOP flippase family protein n=1 Tax=Microbacterium sp. TaxID=51671 RepID=UPI003340AA3F
MTSLKRTTFSGSVWVGASVLVAAVVQLLQMSSVARTLHPAQVGVVAASLVVLALADTIASMGIANSIIQRQDASRRELSSLYWMNVFAGALIAVVLFLSAPLFEWFFRMPELGSLVQVIGLSFLISPHGQVARGMLERHMRFKVVSVIEMISSLIILVVTVALIAVGVGPIAVAIAYASSVSVKALLFLIAARKMFFPSLHFRFDETRRFLSFGILSSVDTIIGFFAANVGSFAVGRLVSPTALGGYNLAFTYAVTTPARLNGVVTRVMFPAISQMRGDQQRQARAIRNVIGTVTMVNAPVLLTLAIVAGPFVQVFFGESWLWIAGLVQVLAGVGITRAMGNPMGAILMALNRMGVGVIVNVIKSTFHVLIVIAATVIWGVYGTSYAALLMGVVTIIVNLVLLRALAGIPIRDGLVDHLKPLVLAVPMVIVGLATMWGFTALGAPAVATLFGVSAICAASYVATLWIVKDPLATELLSVVKR